MTWPNVVRLTVALLLGSTAASVQALQSSTQPPLDASTAPANPANSAATTPQQTPKHQFFGGTVTQLDAQHITVSRTPPGKSAENRSFLITSKTKLSRGVKLRSRVTVRYRHLPEGD